MTKPLRSGRDLVETLIFFGLVIGLIRIFYQMREVAWAAPYVPVVVAIILIYLPLMHSRWRREAVTYFDRSPQQWKRSFRLFAVICLLIFPIFLLLNHLWQEWVLGAHFVNKGLPPLLWVTVDQLFLVSIPEEIFFRGWLQTRLNKRWANRWRIFGVPIGWSWIVTAVLFAVAHSFITFQWWHFSIFFPGLAFGWLREKTGTITTAALFHCACNLIAYWIAYAYR